MIAPWVVEEMKTVDLHDKRLNARLCALLSQFSDRPTASIPASCGGHTEMTAAYRFCDNEKATFSKILQPHAVVTRQRIAAQSVALLVQDTTELDLTRPTQPVHGAGPLDGGSRVGAMLHVLHGFTTDGTSLGTVYAEAWSRDEVSSGSRTRGERAAIPIEEKESMRWIRTLRQAEATAADCPDTQCICLADSEADIYELLVAGQTELNRAHWIIRACQDRALAGESGLLHAYAVATSVLFTNTIQVRGRQAKVACETRGRRQPRESREAEVSIRAVRVTLHPPRRPDRTLPAVTVNVVLVREENPPPGDEPVEWLLLTDLPIDNEQQIRLVIEYYGMRWMIELFFRVLKQGCRIEERRFEQIDRLLTAVTVYLIVSWRTLYTCRLARSCPEISCEAVFHPAEWKAAWKVVRREDPPTDPPALGLMVRLVAQLGGYVNQKSAGPPGPQTVWLGLQRVHDFALCWQMFGPDKNPTEDV